MRLLDAINMVLPRLGERPVTSTEVKHPTLAVLLPIFDRVRKQLLMQGWWFNTYRYTAYPNSDGVIDIGANTLKFIPDPEYPAVVRGQQLYNTKTLTYRFNRPVSGVVVHDLIFEVLPEAAANYVLNTASIEATSTDIGVTQELQVWQAMANEAYNQLMQEHLQQSRYSTKNTKTWKKIQRALRG